MARQSIGIGSNANDGTGDTLRAAMIKTEANFVELYGVTLDNEITISDNNIVANRSNDNINIIPAGTGVVTVPEITVDNNINITDNVIKTTQSNSDLELDVAGSGSVKIDSIKIKDNTISTFESNADLELSANGSGTVVLTSATPTEPRRSAGLR
jgi:hypothetical protein